MENTVLQKPELLKRLIEEYKQHGMIGPIFYEGMDDLTIISILVKEKHSNVVSEFMLRKFQDTFVLQDEYIDIITA